MKVNTHLANVLDAAREKSKYDKQIVKILSNKYILAYIMQGAVEECRCMSLEEIIPMIEGNPEIMSVAVHPGETAEVITGDRNEDKVPGEGSIVYDIRFHAFIPQTKQKVKILINVEAQRKFHPGYDLVTRGIYYGARMISSQRETEFKNSNYDDIKKVYSLWICTDVPQGAKNSVTEYRICEQKLIGDFQMDARYDILNVTFMCLGDGEAEDVPKFLSMLSIAVNERIGSEEKKRILEEKYQIPMTRELRKELETMCNLSEGIEERGIAKGEERASKENAKKFFENGASYELVRASIEILSDEDLQKIYDEVMEKKMCLV